MGNATSVILAATADAASQPDLQRALQGLPQDTRDRLAAALEDAAPPAAIDKIKAIYKSLDAAKTGKVSKTQFTLKLRIDTELLALLENEDTGIKGVSLAPLVAELKKDKDGQISWAELEAALINVALNSLVLRAKFVFEEIDKDHNGKLSKVELLSKFEKDDELEQMLGIVTYRSTLDRIREVFHAADKDGDDSLTWSEFEELVRVRNS